MCFLVHGLFVLPYSIFYHKAQQEPKWTAIEVAIIDSISQANVRDIRTTIKNHNRNTALEHSVINY